MDSTTWAPGKTRRDEQSAQGRRDHRWTHDAAPDSRPLAGNSNTNRPSLSVIAVTQLAMSQQPTVAGRGCWERPPIVGGLPRLQRSAVAQEANGISPTSSLSAMTAISRTPVLPEAARVRALSAQLSRLRSRSEMSASRRFQPSVSANKGHSPTGSQTGKTTQCGDWPSRFLYAQHLLDSGRPKKRSG